MKNEGFTAALDQLLTAGITGASSASQAELQSQLVASLTSSPSATPAAVESNEQQQDPEAPAPETPAPETTAEPETPGEDEAEPSDRIRLGSYSDEDKATIKAAHILARGQKISFADAFARVSGLSHPAAAPQAEPAPPVIPPQIAQLESEVADLEKKMDEAGANEGVFNADVANLTKQLSRANAKLESQRAQHEAQSLVRGEVDEAVFMRERRQSESSVAREFPDATNRSSLLFMTAIAMGKEIADNPQHPLYTRMRDSVNAPMELMEAAAQRLKDNGVTVPRKSVAPSTPQPRPSSASPTSQPARPAPAAGSRTAAPAPNITAQDIVKAMEADLQKVLAGGAAPSGKRRYIIQ